MLIILLTGLSGAGKSTLAIALSELLNAHNHPNALIDGDQYRHTLNKDLGFSEADRRENIRRLAQAARDKKDAGLITILAAINPYEDQRKSIASAFDAKVVYVKCAMEILIERDTKGLYRRALLPLGHPQKLQNLSGVNDRYDVPVAPDLIIETDQHSITAAADNLFKFVLAQLNPASA